MSSNQSRASTTSSATIKNGNPAKTQNETSINITFTIKINSVEDIVNYSKNKQKQTVYDSSILSNVNNYGIELNNDEHFGISKSSNKKQNNIVLTHKYEEDISDTNDNNNNDPQYHGENNDDEQDKLKGNTPIKQKINH